MREWINEKWKDERINGRIKERWRNEWQNKWIDSRMNELMKIKECMNGVDISLISKNISPDMNYTESPRSKLVLTNPLRRHFI